MNADGGDPGRGVPRREWLTIHEASDLIGVSPATLRRWSDAGEIKAFTTPGGHRRFARAAVLGLIPPERRDPAVGRLGDIAERVTRAYRRIGAGATAASGPRSHGDHEAERGLEDGFLARLPENERLPFRELAGAMAGALLELVDLDTAERDGPVVRAETAAAAFGALAAAHGVTIAEAVDAFLALRRPFLHELTSGACRHGFDARQTTDLLECATAAIDELIAALVRGHQSGVETPTHPSLGPVAGPTTAPLPASLPTL